MHRDRPRGVWGSWVHETLRLSMCHEYIREAVLTSLSKIHYVHEDRVSRFISHATAELGFVVWWSNRKRGPMNAASDGVI